MNLKSLSAETVTFVAGKLTSSSVPSAFLIEAFFNTSEMSYSVFAWTAAPPREEPWLSTAESSSTAFPSAETLSSPEALGADAVAGLSATNSAAACSSGVATGATSSAVAKAIAAESSVVSSEA